MNGLVIVIACTLAAMTILRLVQIALGPLDEGWRSKW